MLKGFAQVFGVVGVIILTLAFLLAGTVSVIALSLHLGLGWWTIATLIIYFTVGGSAARS